MATDFSVPNSLTDLVLIVEGKRLHVNRNFLAVHSEVFHKMLFGEFIEGYQKEVTLKEPKYDEFMVLLKIIYLEEEVTAKTCGSLLKLADFYQIGTVVQKCDNFLKNSSNVPMIEKLCLVDNYKLPETKNACFNSVELKKPLFVRDLTRKPEYGKISDKLKVSLLENALNEQMYCDDCNWRR